MSWRLVTLSSSTSVSSLQKKLTILGAWYALDVSKLQYVKRMQNVDFKNQSTFWNSDRSQSFTAYSSNSERLSSPLIKKSGEEDPTIFKSLKENGLDAIGVWEIALLSPLLLAFPNYTAHVTEETDACDMQVERVLLQMKESESTRHAGFWSRSLNYSEKRKYSKHMEALTALCPDFILLPYLEEKWFTVRTEPFSSEWILNLTNCAGWLARWLFSLSENSFVVIHRSE